MAFLIFRGEATPVAEVGTLTPAFVGVGDIFSAIINGRSVSYTAAVATVADVTAGLTAAWNLLAAADFPEFAEITASDTTTEITLTHDTAGVTFVEGLTATAVDGDAADTQTLVVATVTAADGPNVWSATNFRDLNRVNALPAIGDSVWIEDSDVDILYNLDQVAGLLAEINIPAGYTGQIGLPRINTTGTPYEEYRTTDLTILCTTWKIGEGTGTGSSRIKIDLSTAASAVTVSASGSSVENDRHAVQITAGATLSALIVSGGSVDVGVEGGASSNFDAGVTVTGTGVCRIGNAATISAVDIAGSGQLDTDVNLGVVNIRENGTLTKSSGIITTLNVLGGIANIEGAGAITNASLGAGRTLNSSKLAAGVTITNEMAVGVGATINDPAGRLTFTAGYKVHGGGLQDINHVTKQDATVTVT